MATLMGNIHTSAQLGPGVEERLRLLEARVNAVFRPDGRICLESSRQIEINVAGNTLVVDATGIVLRGNARLELLSGNKVAIVAATAAVSAGMVRLDTPMVHASGMVKADTLQATTVIGASYTPGAGNLM